MPFNFSQVTCLIFLSLCVFSSGQVLLKLANHYADQEKACAEYDKCMTTIQNVTKNVPSALKLVDLGPNVAPIPMHQLTCARRSNCRHQQRAFCEPHVGKNGSIEMKVICQLAWMSGSDGTDAKDPITSLGMEEDQKVACSNYEKCLELPNEGFKALQHISHEAAVGHVPKIAKQVTCVSRTNCLQAMKSLCDEERRVDMGHKIAKVVAIVCSASIYSELDLQNSAGSRSLGGAKSLYQEALSEVCKSPKDGVCSLV